MDNTSFRNTVEYYLFAMITFMFGSLLIRISNSHSRRTKKTISKTTQNNSGRAFIYYIIEKLPFLPIPFGFLIILGMYLAFYATTPWSIAGLWIRDQYSIEGLGILKTSLIFLDVLFFTYSGLFLHIKKHFYVRLLVTTFLIIILLLELSIGSRKLIIYLAIILFIPTFVYKIPRRRWLFRLALLALSVFYIIPLRNLPSHGLLAYSGIGWILGITPSPFEQMINDAYFVYYYNAIFGFFMTSYAMNAGVVNWHTFAISVSPLTSNFVGWYKIAPTLRANIYAPFNLFGEIFALGFWFSGLFFFILGSVYTLMDRWIYIKRLQQKLWAYIPMILMAMFILFAYEYNLRSAIRLLYYALGFIGIYSFIQIVRKPVIKRLPNPR